jgi:hypothetical protein
LTNQIVDIFVTPAQQLALWVAEQNRHGSPPFDLGIPGHLLAQALGRATAHLQQHATEHSIEASTTETAFAPVILAASDSRS